MMRAEAVLHVTPQDRESVIATLGPHGLAPRQVEESLSGTFKATPHTAVRILDAPVVPVAGSMRRRLRRRSHKSRLPRTPVVVLARSRDSALAWSLAGAIAVQRPVSASQWKQ